MTSLNDFADKVLQSKRKSKPSREAQDAAVVREILTGEELRRTIGERKREQQAAAEAMQWRDAKSAGALGKCVAVIPNADLFYLHARYGDEIYTKEFLRWFQKEYSHLSPTKI